MWEMNADHGHLPKIVGHLEWVKMWIGEVSVEIIS